MSMFPLWDGIKLGLMLSCLVGPLFFALVQSGAEFGVRGGTMVGLGIWISDILFIAAVYLGLAQIKHIANSPAFTLYLGIGGSITLAGFGLGALLSKPQSLAEDTLHITQPKNLMPALWGKGFLINTVNPFTFFFWIGVSGISIVENNLNIHEAMLFFSGIMGTIMCTDFLKVVGAKKISRHFRPEHFLWLRRLSGASLIIFGVIMLIRVLLMT